MAQYLFSFTILLLSLSILRLEAAPSDDQTRFLRLMKKSLSGNLLAGWDVIGSKPACNFTGIECNNFGYVVKIDVSGWSLSGRFPEDVCTYFPELRILCLGHNHLHGKFPDSITNCSSLEEPNMTSTYLTGTLPETFHR
ncbi:hypothetical protein POM88_042546 [Heracleum sosnowskyi]|uniref:Leucine-rich repeat-containing N-terminal plant-type domain-containing protein n=1 Tax=Heracleum sosnowskyi TaxID=360622 RepID=A0AAD8HJ22_9APIA|nr:hypothetical protein POM88_042546 [Heracleum sosnowskyi]